MSTTPLSPITEGFHSWLNRLKKEWFPKQDRWGRFELRGDGVYCTEYEDVSDPDNSGKTKRIARPEKICSWLEVAAMSRDENSLAWGKVLRWTDHDGKLHQWSTPAPLLVKNSTELVETLAGEGLSITHGKGARVKEYIDTVHPTERCRNVPRTGWYTMPNTGARVFVLPDRVIGEKKSAEAAVYQPESPDSTHQPIRAGSLEDWQKHVAAYCRGNNILTFAVSMGFAGPVLDLLNEPSGGFHLRGHSSKGKTTALASGASVWGHPIATWRTTDNALEDTAERHNDTLLALDELSMLDPRNAVNVAYMLGNGEGKGRSTPTGEAQRKKHWRVLFLSTGEVSLVDHAASVGMRSKAGTEMRMVEIDSDAGKDLGVFEFIHEFEKPQEFADYLMKEATVKYRGSAGPVWIEYLIECGSGVVKELHAMIDELLRNMVPEGAGGEIHRVARRFAVVGAAGEVATMAGITGWEPAMALNSARWCFERWLAKRTTLGSSDVEKAIRHLRGFLQTYGDSRFDSPNGFPCRDRAGFKRTLDKGEVEYLIIPEVFEAELKPFADPTKVAQELRKRGCLRAEPNRLKVQFRTDTGKGWFYAIQSSILGDGGDDPPLEPVPVVPTE